MAEKLTGINAETIRGLARQMGRTERKLLLAGACSVCSTVNVGVDDCRSGGDAGANWPARCGFGFGWHYNGAGTPGRKGVI